MLVSVFILSSCKTDPFPEDPFFNEEEYYAGGATTIFDASSAAFSTPAPNLSGARRNLHIDGDAQFEQTFVTAPATINSGLGPVFNQRSCNSCHVLDGRGAEPTVFRVSIPGGDIHGGPNPVPGFGGQLQNFGVASIPAEGEVNIEYIEAINHFLDGKEYLLQGPVYSLINLYKEYPGDAMLSVRIAPPVFGLGLLEAISEEDILKHADPYDQNKDGISGKPNYVWDQQLQKTILGRFGWKANQPNLLQQTAAAFSEDMGITNQLFPMESCFNQSQYDGLNDELELNEDKLKSTAFYVSTLAVPAPRNLDDPAVILGKKIFYAAKCSSCHTPLQRTGYLESIPEVSNQTIYPYTDLLLHDMGNELADNRPDFMASGNEWRTPPLWGIGLTEIVNGHQRFLHDGRAGSLLEAIMWHGGEAEASKEYVRSISSSDRELLIRFLMAL